jgi:hypothetical protein
MLIGPLQFPVKIIVSPGWACSSARISEAPLLQSSGILVSAVAVIDVVANKKKLVRNSNS